MKEEPVWGLRMSWKSPSFRIELGIRAGSVIVPREVGCSPLKLISWCIYTTEYYSALKRKEILTHTTTWMNFEDIMLSAISQTQKDTHCMTPLP